jgi:non-haem Fe2+, alpha-ketoglutarate-dependent halogenase
LGKVLTEEQIAAFHENGYHAPVRVMAGSRARDYRDRFEAFERRHPDDVIKLDQKAYMIAPWAYEMLEEPAFLDTVEDLIGPDILCWGQSLRLKRTDGKSFAGWHQDTAYANVQPINVIAALALSPCRVRQGCIRAIPGSHKWDLLPHKENFGTASILSREQTIDADFDDSTAVEMELDPGECAFFYHAICHSSGPNHGPDRRIVFLNEMIPTHARQDWPRESAVLLRGIDEYDNWDRDRVAEAEMGSAELEAWRKAVEVQASVLFGGARHAKRALEGKMEKEEKNG